MITPTTTAIAKSSATVTAVTTIMTRPSERGTLRKMRKECQANVPITTMNITPTNAAIGICSIRGEANRMKDNRNNAAVIPATRVRPPDFTLIIDWPIIAQPPIPPKNPVTRLAAPCAIHSWLAPPFCSVISPTRFKVSKLSINPIAAKISA